MNSSDGYFSCSWLFAEQVPFKYEPLNKLLARLAVTRLKGRIQTDRDTCVFYDEDGTLNVNEVNGVIDTIMIHNEPTDWAAVEQ